VRIYVSGDMRGEICPRSAELEQTKLRRKGRDAGRMGWTGSIEHSVPGRVCLSHLPISRISS
jgi:hypothetical protein